MPRLVCQSFRSTGLRVSLRPEMLEGIDVLVYDIQDIGCRSFTYISTMGLAMEGEERRASLVVIGRPSTAGVSADGRET